MRVLRCFPTDLIGFIMESCEDARSKYDTKPSILFSQERECSGDVLNDLGDDIRAAAIPIEQDVPIIGESMRGQGYGQEAIVIPGEEKLPILPGKPSPFFEFMRPPLDMKDTIQLLNETTEFSMRHGIEQLTAFFEEIKKGSYLFSRGAIYDRNELIASSGPKRIEYDWCHGTQSFSIDCIMHTEGLLEKMFGNNAYILLGKHIDTYNTIESATPSIFLKKRTRPKNKINYNGDGIIFYDDQQNIFREAHFDGEDYQAKKEGKIIDPNDLTIVGEPSLVYYVGEPSDLVALVEEEKKPNTLLAVGKITRGAECPSMGHYRWILPIVRFQLADFERIHEELGTYARELVK